jgi:hypothetical protein
MSAGFLQKQRDLHRVDRRRELNSANNPQFPTSEASAKLAGRLPHLYGLLI